jgi:hypothetical protein
VHAICSPCLRALEPLDLYSGHVGLLYEWPSAAEGCCWCGAGTSTGIYLRMALIPACACGVPQRVLGNGLGNVNNNHQ